MQRETYSARTTTNIEFKLNTYFDKENHQKAWSKLCSLSTTNIEMKESETHSLVCHCSICIQINIYVLSLLFYKVKCANSTS